MAVRLNSSPVSAKKPSTFVVSSNQRGDRADGEMPFEADPDVDEHRHAGEQHGEDSGIGQLTADLRSDDFDAIEACLGLDIQYGCLGPLGELCLRGCIRVGRLLHTNEDGGAVRPRLLQTDLTEIRLLETCAEIANAHRRRRLGFDDRAAGEVDAIVQSRIHEQQYRRDGQYQRCAEADEARAHHLKFRRHIRPARRQERSNHEVARSPPPQPQRHDGSDYSDCGEHRDDDAERHRDGETAHRSRAEPEQERRGDEGSDVGVYDRRIGALEATREACNCRLAVLYLLAMRS